MAAPSHKIPFLLVGDAPYGPSGFSRILTDVATRIHRAFPELDVRTCGHVNWQGLPKVGTERDMAHGTILREWVFNDVREDWGASAIVAAYRKWWGNTTGIVMTIWDASWCYAYRDLPLPVEKWGYIPVDAHNMNGTFSGPPAEALKDYALVVAYNAYGAQVLGSVLGSVLGGPPPHLPHGIDVDVFRDKRGMDYSVPSFFHHIPPDSTLVGVVATNTPRKDWGMAIQATRYLHASRGDVYLWCHIDKLVTEAWSLPQLLMDAGLEDRVVVTTTLSPETLAACYAACDVTIAPGRGEGHGYPIVESLAVGTPVVHADYAGGGDILRGQAPEWLVPAETYHLVGPYALKRPILQPMAVASTLEAILNSPVATRTERAVGIGQSYRWRRVWPEWATWVQSGLAEFNQRNPTRGDI